MAKVELQEYNIWYDDETYLIYNSSNEIVSNIPNGTFAFQGKVYTYGTKVKIKDSYHTFTAIFQKDTEEKEVIVGGRFCTYSMEKAKEYYDNRPFELDDIFKEIDGTRKVRLSSVSLDNGVLKIVDAVPYVRESDYQLETPPTTIGYRTVSQSNNDPTLTTWKDHLYNCIVDYEGNILNWFEPKTFGYQKHLYTVGTKVILKHRWCDKNHYYVAVFNGYRFVIEGYPTVGIYKEIKDSNFKRFGIGDKLKKNPEIIHVIEPHYYAPASHEATPFEKFKASGEATKPADVSIGWVWYILIMAVGTIFKARVLIWIAATVIFFLWKYGHLNSKK